IYPVSFRKPYGTNSNAGIAPALPCRVVYRASGKARRPVTQGLLVVVLDLFELGIDHVIAIGIAGVRRLAISLGRLGLLGVHLLHHGTGGLGQCIDLRFDQRLVVTLDRLFQFSQRILDSGFLFLGSLVARLGQRLAGSVDQLIALVAHGDQFLELAVLIGIGLGITHHLLDFFIAQPGVGLDHDRLLFTSGLVLGRHIEDTVGIDVEADLDLRYTTLRRRDVGQVETAQRLVLRRLLALTLQHVDGYGSLIVVRGREHLRLLGRAGGVLLDQRGHHTAHGFDTQRQRGYVQQQHVLHVTGQYRTLDRSTHGNRFIRVDVFARLLAEELGNGLLHQRHTGLTTHQDHFVDLGYIQAGVLHGDAARLDTALDQLLDQRLQLGAGHL